MPNADCRMPNGRRGKPVFIASALFALTASFILLFAAEPTNEVMFPLRTIELSIPPGERSVVALEWEGENVLGGYTEAARFACDLKSGHVTRQPINGDPRGMVAHRPFVCVPNSKLVYYLDAVGKLCSIDAQGTREIGQIAGTRPFEKEGYQVSRALVLDAEGNVYTAGKEGCLFRYSPNSTSTNKLERLAARLPAVKGREPWASLDAAVPGSDGLIYGGTFDGYLFTFNPKTLEVINLGKPLRQQRIRGLVFSRGKLYGVGGEEDGWCRGFAFDPRTRGFELGGPLRLSAYKLLLEPVSAMVADKDGNIYIGTSGRLGNLYEWEAK